MNQWSKAYLETALKCLDAALDIETDYNIVSTLYCAFSGIKNLLDEAKAEEIIDSVNEALMEEEQE